MPRIPTLLAECSLVAAIAVTTAVVWMHVAGHWPVTVGAVIVCAGISVTAVLVLEAAVRRVRRGRPRRAHARPHPNIRKDTHTA